MRYNHMPFCTNFLTRNDNIQLAFPIICCQQFMHYRSTMTGVSHQAMHILKWKHCCSFIESVHLNQGLFATHSWTAAVKLATWPAGFGAPSNMHGTHGLMMPVCKPPAPFQFHPWILLFNFADPEFELKDMQEGLPGLMRTQTWLSPHDMN